MNARFFSLFIVLTCCAGPAFAHAFLDHARPAAGETVASSPKQIMLTFTEALEPAFSGAAVTDAAGHDVTAGSAAVTGQSISVSLKALAPGTYRVTWHAVSVDTHRTDGSYSFTVKQ